MTEPLNFIICSPFPHYTGGRETWLYNVSQLLADRGYKIKIFSYKDDALPASFPLARRNIVIQRITILSSFRFLSRFTVSYLRLLDYISFIVLMCFSVMRALPKGSTVIAMGPIIDCMPVIIANKVFGRRMKLICSVRGFHAEVMASHFSLLKSLWYRLEDLSFRNSAAIWCNGNDTLHYVEAKGYIAKLMPNGVDFNKYSESTGGGANVNDDPRSVANTVSIVSTATLLPIKGVQELIDAIPIVASNVKRTFKVTWVGKGDINRYRSYAQAKHASQYIEFTGEKKDTAPYLRGADVVVCLSGGGGMSMALLEAMASRKPIVAWDNQVYRLLLEHGRSGILVRENDAHALAEALSNIIDNYEQYTFLGENAQKIVQQYDWEHIAARVAESSILI